ncbi:MAG: DUF4012 domain-containing protein [Candidatus Falkowbacteria bacterium]|nr:DUF4012 domain-containing protein [Candidatus Falkowbacteria bacterium]
MFKRKHPSAYLNLYLSSLRAEFRHLTDWRYLKNKIKSGRGRFAAKPRLKISLGRRSNPVLEFFYFILILLILIIPFKVMSYFFDLNGIKDRVLSQSQSGLNSFLAGANKAAGLDLSGANSEFSLAGQKFLEAQTEADSINKNLLSLASLSSDPKVKMAAEGQKFLAAGTAAASLGQNLTAALDSLFNNPDKNISQILDNFSYYGELSKRDLAVINQNLAAVKVNNLPVEYQGNFIALRVKVEDLNKGLGAFVTSLQSLKEFLGLSQDKRYLLVFQNNTELRASGGFLGSYALVDLHEGKIKNLEVPGGGSYDTEAGLKDKIIAPAPLWLVNPQWHFWDCNWWPDWPTTAQNIMWFYEKSDGPTVDGVISFTPTVVERLLEVTGPIDLSQEYGVIIDSNNFWATVQTVVENKDQGKITTAAVASSTLLASSSLTLDQGLDQNSKNKPKKIIGDLMAKILEELPKKLNKDSLIKLISLTEKNLSEKQILFYFSDPKLEAAVADHNWAGIMRPAKYDYLAVINTNIAGQKSDRKIQEKIDLVSNILSDGSVINTLKISRTHTGVKREPFTGVRNVDWLRVYVPAGSQLLEASGFSTPDANYFSTPEAGWEINPILAKYENIFSVDPLSGSKIYQENNKTVFANWVMVDPGETAVVTLKYRLPFNILNQANQEDWLNNLNSWLNPSQPVLLPYSLLAQKQPGAQASELTSRLILSGDWPLVWNYPQTIKANNEGWDLKVNLDSDKYWAVILAKNNN